MTILSRLKRSGVNAEAGNRPYVSQDDYPTQMRKRTQKAVNDISPQVQSELVRPYKASIKSYAEHEYYQVPPPGIEPWPFPTFPPIPLPTFRVATPIFSVVAGYYTSIQTVQIVCLTPGATIYYTTDNTEPHQNSAKYVAPLTLSADTKLRAKAFKDTWESSITRYTRYYINLGEWYSFTDDTFWTPRLERGTGFPYGIWTGTVWTRNEDTTADSIILDLIGTWYLGFRPSKFRMTYTGTKPGEVSIYFVLGIKAAGITYTDYDSLEEENLISGGIYDGDPIDADISGFEITGVAADFAASNIEFFA